MHPPVMTLGLPRWLSDKESACQAGDVGLIPDSERSPRQEHGNPLQYSCLEYPMDKRGAWWDMVHGVTELDSTEHVCTHTRMMTPIFNMTAAAAAAAAAKSLQLCLTPSNPMDCSLPGSSTHGIFQARVLEWGAIVSHVNFLFF